MSSQNQLKKELSRQGTEVTRNHIERIVSSYRHIWDIYTELLQNSADAIIEQFGEENIDQGLISLSIEIETNNRKITITDNGIGIEESEIARILVHGESLKRKRNKSKYGFMGFGFTFVAFQSSFLKIESIKDNLKSSRTYHDLYKFVYEESVLPQSEEENSEITKQECEQPNSTIITVIFPQKFPNEMIEQSLLATFRIAQSPDVFEAVLRTRSVVGMLDPIFDPNKQNFQFDLKIDDKPLEKIKDKIFNS
jgi:archaellum component FlaF (FlaF/FlaG flagellin family)